MAAMSGDEIDWPARGFADEDHYREEEILHWSIGQSHVDDAVIAQWLLEIAQRPAKAKAVPTAPAPEPQEAQFALSYAEAARLLDYSPDHFERHVVPNLRVIITGRRKSIPRAELVRWVEEHSARALKGA